MVDLKKDFRILLASIVLLIIIYLKKWTWDSFGNTLYWIISISLMIYCLYLCIWLIFEITKWVRDGLKESYHIGVYSATLLILLLSIYEMR
jgi:hypothetical protein